MMSEFVLAGRYSFGELIGHGAMGEVWAAKDLMLNRRVAIKRVRLHASLDDDDAYSKRFLREARTAAQLHHPNAVAVYDFQIVDDQSYVVMEYVEGESLAQRIKRVGSLPVAEAAPIIGQIAAALEAAHTLGIVHRDVKPANVLISRNGAAKLADFGIARSVGDTALTDAGQMIGTLAFMAPEVARGERASGASDVWSLGATFHDAIEGSAPFADPSGDQQGPAMVLRLVSEAAPAARNAGDFAGLLSEMLDREPTRRPFAGDVSRRIDRALALPGDSEVDGASQRSEVHQTPPSPGNAVSRGQASKPRRRRRSWTMATLGLAVALATTIASLVILRHPSASSRNSGTRGHTFAVSSAAAARELARGQAASFTSIPWSSVRGGWTLALWDSATDGSRSKPSVLLLVDPEGGRYTIATLPAGTELVAWTSDGRRALVLNNTHVGSSIDEVSLLTGTRRQVLSRPTDMSVIGYTDNGSSFIVNQYSNDSTAAVRVSLAGKVETTFPTGNDTIGNFDGRGIISPDGSTVVLNAAHGLAVFTSDGQLVRTINDPVPFAQCAPKHWFEPAVLIVNCRTQNQSGNVVQGAYETLISGAGSTKVAAPIVKGASNVYRGGTGYQDAWNDSAGLLLVGPDSDCSPGELFQTDGGSHVTLVHPLIKPDPSGDSVFIVGSSSDDFVGLSGGCGAGGVLASFNPTTGARSVLLGSGMNGGTVHDALALPSPS